MTESPSKLPLLQIGVANIVVLPLFQIDPWIIPLASLFDVFRAYIGATRTINGSAAINLAASANCVVGIFRKLKKPPSGSKTTLRLLCFAPIVTFGPSS